jgi:hypothetical protein
MVKRLASQVAVAFLSLALSSAATAQISLQSTPAPTVTAENESWYLSGGPISFGGNVYFPAGAEIHFVRDEMVRTGSLGNVAIYVRTTQEPGSIIYVPLAGGLMRPYERRRTGDLAGTTGSSAPSFVATSPSESTAAPTLQAAAPPTGVPAQLTGRPATVSTVQPVSALPASTAGTTGRLPVQTRPARTRVQTVQRPVGLNSVFIQFQGARWYAAGPAVEFSANRFTRIGEHRGFTVYQDKGKPGLIYLSLLTGGGGLVAPYKSR